jgi:hypothetical protein
MDVAGAAVRVVAVLVLTSLPLVQAQQGKVMLAVQLLVITIRPAAVVAGQVQLAGAHKVRRLLLPAV